MRPPMAERFVLPPLITGTTWQNVVSSLIRQQGDSRGLEVDGGETAPAMTNREALAIVSAMRAAAQRVVGFPLWYQFAAIAYGWNPQGGDLDGRDAQGDADYPPYAGVMLVQELTRLAAALDAVHYPDARIDIPDVWAQPPLMAEIGAALQDDGAQVAFKIPLPACKDPKTGAPAKPVRNPKTGRWECPGGVIVIDDPITAVGKSLIKVAIPVVGLWLLYEVFLKPRRRRSKD